MACDPLRSAEGPPRASVLQLCVSECGETALRLHIGVPLPQHLMQGLVQVRAVAVAPAYAALEVRIAEGGCVVAALTTVEQVRQNEAAEEHGEPSWPEKLVAYPACVDFARAEAGPRVFEGFAAELARASTTAEVASLFVYLPP